MSQTVLPRTLPEAKPRPTELIGDAPDGEARLSPPRVLAALLIGACSLVALLFSGTEPIAPATQLVLATCWVVLICLAALVLITAMPLNTRGVSRWRSAPWYLIWSTLTFGLASLTWLDLQTGTVGQTGATGFVEPSSVVTALNVFGASIVVWTVGYLVSVPRLVQLLASRGLSLLLHGTAPAMRGGAHPLVLFGVGNAARLATALLTGRLGYLGDASDAVAHATSYTHALDLVSWLAVFAIAAAAYQVFSTPDGKGKAMLWSMVAVDVTVGALGGTKQSFFLTLLAVLIPYGALRGRVSLRLAVASALLFLWIILPFNTAYRTTVRDGASYLSPGDAVAAAPGVVSGVVSADAPLSVAGDSSSTLLRRVRNIDNIAVIVQLTPSTIPFRNPGEYISAPIFALVPRAIWPDKPVLSTGYEFSQEYYGLPSTMYTASAITPVGDLYRHGGWPVMAIGMLLFGMTFRLFDTLFHSEKDPRAIFFLLFFLPMLVQSENDIYSLLVSVPTGLAAALLGVHLTCRRPAGTT